ncbi:MAG: hypothetical protein R3B48_26765 [Kofleriaceae bacterium]
MSRRLEAIRICKTVLEPLLLREGFTGTFPYYHRSGKACVEGVHVLVYAHPGVQVLLGSVPARPKLEARTAERDAKAYAYPCDPGARMHDLPVRFGIATAAEVRALPAKLATIVKALRTEGAKFWASHQADLDRQTLLREVADAVESGKSAQLSKALARLPHKQAQTILDQTNVKNWSARSTIARTYGLRPALLAFRPPWMLGAILATGAALVVQDGKATRQARAQALEVLAWVARHIQKVKDLAAQLAIITDHLLPKDVIAAMTLFDRILSRKDLRRPHYGNALWSVLSTNNRQPIDRARHQRFLKAALTAAPDDPSVQFNAACAYMELDDTKAAQAHLLLALKLGAPPQHARQEPLLRSLLTEPHVAKALGAPAKKPRGSRGYVSHRAPRRR